MNTSEANKNEYEFLLVGLLWVAIKFENFNEAYFMKKKNSVFILRNVAVEKPKLKNYLKLLCKKKQKLYKFHIIIAYLNLGENWKFS